MRTLAAVVAAALCTSAAFGQDAAQQQLQIQVKRGEKLLQDKCASCHAVGNAGASPRANVPELRTIGRRYPVESLEEALAENSIPNHPAMTNVEFETDDVSAIIAYLKSIQVR